VPDLSGASRTDVASNDPRDYTGRGAFAHYYTDQLKGGAKYDLERAQEFADQCLSGKNKIDLGQIGVDAAKQAGRNAGIQFTWEKVVSGLLGGWRTYARKAVLGGAWGATKSVVRQSCGL
jgi:hypothetical protein